MTTPNGAYLFALQIGERITENGGTCQVDGSPTIDPNEEATATLHMEHEGHGRWPGPAFYKITVEESREPFDAD